MRLFLFALTTYGLAGLSGAVLWRRLLGRRGAGRGLDSLLWLAGSPFIVSGSYYLTLGVAPGRASTTYAVGLTLLYTAVLVLLPRTTGAVLRDLWQTARLLWRRHAPGGRGWRTAVVLAQALGVGVLAARTVSMALHQPYYEHDALVYATQGWEWHEQHDLAYWRPGEPMERGFVIRQSHSPGFEVLHAWAADWMPARFHDAPLRSIAPMCWLAGAVVLVVLTTGAGRWGPWWSVGLYLMIPDVLAHVGWHGRDAYRLLGALLFLAALVRCRRLPWLPQTLGVGAAGAAALTGHTLGLYAVGLTGAAWGLVHWRQWRRTLAVLPAAVLLAVALGGKQYVVNVRTTGSLRGVSGQEAHVRDNPEVYAALWKRKDLAQRGVRDLGRKFAVMCRRKAAWILPAAFLGIGLVAIQLARGAVSWKRVGRLERVAAVALVGHLGAGAGLADRFYANMSIFFVINARYQLHAVLLGAIALVYATRAVRYRRGSRLALLLAMEVCLVVGFMTFWPNSSFERRHHVFPSLPGSVAFWPAQDPYIIARISQRVGDAPVFVINVPEIYYYTDLRGRTYDDPVFTPLYAQAGNPAAQHRMLWDMGFRYIVAPDRMDDYLDTLGFTALFDDPAYCRLIEARSIVFGKTIYFFELVPPAEAGPPPEAR